MKSGETLQTFKEKRLSTLMTLYSRT